MQCMLGNDAVVTKVLEVGSLITRYHLMHIIIIIFLWLPVLLHKIR